MDLKEREELITKAQRAILEAIAAVPTAGVSTAGEEARAYADAYATLDKLRP